MSVSHSSAVILMSPIKNREWVAVYAFFSSSSSDPLRLSTVSSYVAEDAYAVALHLLNIMTSYVDRGGRRVKSSEEKNSRIDMPGGAWGLGTLG